MDTCAELCLRKFLHLPELDAQGGAQAVVPSAGNHILWPALHSFLMKLPGASWLTLSHQTRPAWPPGGARSAQSRGARPAAAASTPG